MTAGVPGVTTRDASERKPGATRSAVALQGFQRVGGARRVKATTRPQERAHRIAIPEHQQGKHPAHGDPRRQRSTSASATSRALRRITKSRLPRLACCARNNSLKTRFIRLRSTARGKNRLGTITPSLGTPNALTRESTLNPGRLWPRPRASSAAMSVVPSRNLRPYRLRALKRSSGRALWRGAPESRRGPRACACERETRECASYGRQRGEKYVSSREFPGTDRTFH